MMLCRSIGVRLNQIGGFGRHTGTAFARWTPSRLFASGEIGAWYDPSDLTTMFQDSAGTTPVTAVGQAVGLILDKSQGLALGAELVTNGDFSSGSTGWTVGSNWAVSGGAATATGAVYNTNNLDQLVAFVSGRTYKLTFNVTAYTAGSLRVDIVGVQSVITGGVTAAGAYTYYFVAGITGTPVFRITGSTGGGFTGSIDNISVKELAGNHASQSTPTARPTLSARVNLLTYSEQFDNAAWTKDGGASATGDTVTAPDGNTTADTLTDSAVSGQQRVYQTITVSSGAQVTFSVCLKQGTRRYARVALNNSDEAVVVADLQAGTITTGTNTTTWVIASSSIASLGNGWYRVSITASKAATTTYYPIVALCNVSTVSSNGYTYTGNGSTIYIWGADLRPANQVNAGMPTYQRIAAATDYDTTGFPTFLSFDGTDDFLVTGTINPGSADKAQIFAGVRKLSNSGLQTVVSHSTNPGSTNGTFDQYFNSAVAGHNNVISKGTVGASINAASGSAPINIVMSALMDISGDNITSRINAAQIGQSSGDQGTGNYSSNPLYIGSRAGASLWFNGNVYSLIVRFSAANLDASVISQAETWVNTKTLAY